MGGGGADVLAGGGAADQLDGGVGADRMIWAIGDGADTLIGGAGADVAEIRGGGAADAFSLTAADGNVVLEVAAPTAATLDIRETETIEIFGGGGDDLSTIGDLTGTAVTRVFFSGGDGDDILDGSASSRSLAAEGGVIQINHVIVDESGMIYACDRGTGGLYILRLEMDRLAALRPSPRRPEG